MAVVVGIFSGSDPQELRQALAEKSLGTKLRVFTSAEPSQVHDDAPFDFVHVAEAQRSNSLSGDMTRGTGIMSDAGGTSVPGINGGAALSAFYRGPANDYLSGVGIPEDEAGQFQ